MDDRAERDERALRITLTVIAHGLASLIVLAFVLGGSALDFGIYALSANAALTFLFLHFYFSKIRKFPLTELMLLEILSVAVAFTLTCGYALDRSLWLLLFRP